MTSPRRPRPAAPATDARRPASSRRGGAKTLAFVTGNRGKVAELRALAEPLGYTVVQDARGYPEVQADSLQQVCAAGAQHLLATGLAPPFLLEDSGLFVSALRGFPGVHSRHALETIGCQGILRLLRDAEHEMRTAAFQTHLLYVDAQGRTHGFDGVRKGRIPERAAGTGGFGFDPIFAPEGGGGRTFAEMDTAQKNALSHRGAAVRALLAHLAKSPSRSP